MTQFDVIQPVIDAIANRPAIAQVYILQRLAVFRSGGLSLGIDAINYAIPTELDLDLIWGNLPQRCSSTWIVKSKCL
jgi:hypothetical protein